LLNSGAIHPDVNSAEFPSRSPGSCLNNRSIVQDDVGLTLMAVPRPLFDGVDEHLEIASALKSDVATLMEERRPRRDVGGAEEWATA